MRRFWKRLFLEERPSVGLSFFRIFLALTAGFHVLPSFCHLDDTYFSTAFKTYNLNFFPPEVVDLVQKSPDEIVASFVGLFCVSWFFFLIGLWSQVSCILMTVSCYYFYALNAFHVGTLSWDILLVTLFLMCLTPYHGDYFSVDCLKGGREDAYRMRRPFFIQRLLQMQIAWTYFYTACYKISPQGNWLTGNPLYYLMNDPPTGVTKYFLLRDFLRYQPEICYAVGVFIVVLEFLMIFLLFYPPTRISAIYLGFIFHVTLILTLDVPAIFFFLFPPQLLLFIHPDKVIRWIEQKRTVSRSAQRHRLIYDGNCQFCLESVRWLRIMDLFDCLEVVDSHKIDDLHKVHSRLDVNEASSQLYLVEPDGTLYGGFRVFQRLCFLLPMLYPMVLIFYFPGAGIIGPLAYRWVAQNRYLFHLSRTCRNNSCFR